MRVFALSDIHVDYAENLEWVLQLHDEDYLDDILVLAGDVSDNLDLLAQVLQSLQSKFAEVLFVPGNHELWVEDDQFDCSLVKLAAIEALCESLGIRYRLFEHEQALFLPLLSWYDFSFGEPDRHLLRAWRDFRACSWPEHLDTSEAISEHFLERNLPLPETGGKMLITFSHFLPRIDVMPHWVPEDRRRVYPVLGSVGLGEQIKQLKPSYHIYGHSHVNQSIELDGVKYINNAFAYPREDRISGKRLRCVIDLAAAA